MHRFKADVEHVMLHGTEEQKKYLADIMYTLGTIVHEYKYETMKYYKIEVSELAHGTTLTECMIEDVLCDMHWTLSETTQVKNTYGLSGHELDYYFLANLYYKKYYDVVSEEDILKMAKKDIKESYHHWKILKMLK